MTNCPLCHSKKIEQFQPIPTSNRGAKIVQKIEYAFCHRCSIIFNSTIFKNRGQYKKLFFKTIQKELFIENNSKVELHNRLFSYLEIFKKYNAPKIPNTHSPKLIFQPDTIDTINQGMESQTMERTS